jgi:hypothetical protein
MVAATLRLGALLLTRPRENHGDAQPRNVKIIIFKVPVKFENLDILMMAFLKW